MGKLIKQLGDRLQWAMNERGVDAQRLANETGIKYHTISKILRNETKSMKADTCAALCKRLDISDGWLISGVGVATISKLQMDVQLEGSIAAPNTITIPRLSVVASMGRGIESMDNLEDVVYQLIVHEDWLDKHLPGINRNKLAIITGGGDSMAPTINDGDLLLVDYSAAEIHKDGVYVLSADTRLFVKRVMRKSNRKLLISSDNPAVKLVEELDEKNGHDVIVHGRVVWVFNGRKL
jgi:transcriptional regulator with XRE-family HTH domain